MRVEVGFAVKKKPATPFPTITEKARRIYALAVTPERVLTLSFGIACSGKAVRPAQVIPIVHVKSDGHHLPPQAGILGELAQPAICRWATAATFRGVQFEQGGLLWAAAKVNHFSGASRHLSQAAEKQGAEYHDAV